MRNVRLFQLMFALMLACALGITIAPRPAHAIGALIVQSTADTDDGTKDPCTLREALQAIANAKNAGSAQSYHECASADPMLNTIIFSVSGTIKLANTLPDITTKVTLTGPIIIDGGKNVILRVGSDGFFSMAAITMTHGNPAILVSNGSPTINIAGSSFVGNDNDHGAGGAINASGTLNIAGTNFTGNSSVDNGGAIAIGGSDKLTIGGSVFNGNIAKHSGGAIYTKVQAKISDVVFNGNIANGSDPNNDGSDNEFDDYATVGGGAIFSSNSSSDGQKLAITRSVFNGNLSPKGYGGAVYVASGSAAEVVDSSLQGNLAGTPPSTNRQGGAFVNMNGKLSLDRTVLLNNAVVGNGGAVANDRQGTLNLTNVSLIANAATSNGAGVYNMNTQTGSPQRPQLTALNTTFSANAAAGSGGGIYNQDGAPANVANTIVASSDGSGLGGNCAGGALTSQGHNLDSGTSCAFNQAGDLTGDPKLDTPSFNGGPLASLLTQKLLPGSAAIDAGDPAICAADPVGNKDERGQSRPNDGDGNASAICDIGAYEAEVLAAGFGSTPVQPGPINLGSATVGGTATGSFSVYETGNITLQLGNPSLSGAQAGEFAVTGGLPASINDGGAAQQVTLSCTPAAVGQRSATLSFSTNDPNTPSVSFTLMCSGTPQPQAGFGSTPAAPGPLSLGTTTVGSTLNANISVQETGNATLTVGSPTLAGTNPGDFAVNSALSLSISDGGAAQSIPVSCTPTGPGVRTAILTLTTNDPSKLTVSFALSCKGVLPPTPLLDVPGQSIGNSLADGNKGPYGLAASPDGKNVYAADDGDGLVTVYGRGNDGTLVFRGGNIDGSGGSNDLAGARILAVSPDGKNVYASAWNDDAVTAFTRNPDNGDLTFLDRVKEGDGYGFCLPPSPCSQLQGLDGVYGLALSADGRFVYASSINSDSIVVLNRDQSDGGISLGIVQFPVQVYQNTTDLSAAYGITLSPDGAFLYATGFFSSTVLVFSRNATTGKITLVDKLSTAQVPSLNGVFRISISPDGAFAYTASYTSNSITAFKRNPADGKLTYLAAYTNGVAGVDGLGQASSVIVSADGTHVYATGHSSNAVVVFERDAASGLLTFLQVVKRDAGGKPALAGARDVIESTDGRMLFATGHDDNRVVSLALANPKPTLASLAPASATAGAATLTITLNGEQFVHGAVAKWNGAPLPTSFVNANKLTATVDASLLGAAGTATVTVANPTPGGGESNGLTFSISAPGQNPVPSISQISPSGAAAGDPALTLTVTGANFITSSRVQWNGTDRPTTFVSSTTLQAKLSIADLAQPGVAGVSVITNGPGGGTSNTVAFTIAAPGENPVPSIISLSPPSANAGSVSGDLMVTVTGANFVPESQAFWNGATRPTTVVDSTTIQIAVSAADIVSPGSATITIANPAPGGGESNAATFSIGASGDNPVPVLSGYNLSRNSDGSFVVTLSGVDFVNGATVQWNGVSRAANIVDPTHVNFTVSLAEFAASPSVVNLANPAPGGGVSNDLVIAVRHTWMPLSYR